jgi:hypothetical protein
LYNSGCQGHGHGRVYGRGLGSNIYIGSYSLEQWQKLSSEGKQQVHNGWQCSADQHSQNNTIFWVTYTHQRLTFIQIDTSDPDIQSQLTGPYNIKPSIFQGTLQGSTSDTCPNTDSASSYISRQHVNLFAS